MKSPDAVAHVAQLRWLESKWVMPTYARAGVEFVRGERARLWDSAGTEYLDFFAGLSVHNAGHCHPEIVAAIQKQVATFAGSSNLFYSEPNLRLAERLSESSLGGQVFLCNSGTEANECAIKLARKHAHQRGIERPEIVSLDGGFHGRTLGSLAATPRLADERNFGPLPRGFAAADRDDADALRDAVNENTAAIIIEPIQGEAGVFVIGERVLIAARELCDETGAILIFDEVQTGMGRTGTLWAFEQESVRPDVMTTAKALGGGLPAGAVVVHPSLDNVFGPGDHGSTFAGGPVTAAAALATIDVIDEQGLLSGVREMGARFMSGLRQFTQVVEVRGRGLMVGATLEEGRDAHSLRDRALDAGLVINATGPDMVRFLPPLVIDEDDVQEALEKLQKALRGF